MGEDRFQQDGVGKMVDVYDGRKWPVAQVASVYVHPVDNVHKVTQAVLTDPSVGKRKWRTNKYTVVVGTTHGHVQVFLSDDDLVLKAFQSCKAEEKCLLLIKKPKEASKKLLKTQSLNNLSMSDTHQQKHRHDILRAFFTSNKTKGQLSLVLENDKSKKKGAKKPQVNTFVPIPELGIFTPEQHVLQNGTYAQYCHLFREVNNNNSSSAKNYENLPSTDVALASNSSFSSTFDDSASSYGFGQRDSVQLEGSGLKQNKFEEAYHSCIDLSQTPDAHSSHFIKNTRPHPVKPPRDGSHNRLKQIKEENNLEHTTRSHSLGDLTTGLTFSLVGQHKLHQASNSVDENCWDSLNNNKSVNKHNMTKHKGTAAPSNPYKSSALHEKKVNMKTSEKDQFPSDLVNGQLNDTKRQTFQERFPLQRQNSAPEVIQPQLSVFPTEMRMETEEPSYRPRAAKVRQTKDYSINVHNVEQNSEARAPVIRKPLLNNWQNNGPVPAQNSRTERSSPREQSPMKPKRSLPIVPLADTSERVKRLTDVMKSRIANSSRSNSQIRMTSESTLTQNNGSWRSCSETNSDSDVFVDAPSQPYVLSCRMHYSDSSVVHSSPKFQPRSAFNVGSGSNNNMVEPQSFRHSDKATNDGFYPSSPVEQYVARRQEANMRPEKGYYSDNFDCSYSDQQSVPQGDRSSDSTQTTITNQSHNGSIMDSGYTTNNESDSFNSAHRAHYGEPAQHDYQPSSRSPHNYSNIVSNHSPVMLVSNSDSQHKCYQIYNSPVKKQSNLMFSRQFGSVQNISSSQSHVTTKHSELFGMQDKNAAASFNSQPLGNTQLPAVRKLESRRLTLDGCYYPSQNTGLFTAYANLGEANKAAGTGKHIKNYPSETSSGKNYNNGFQTMFAPTAHTNRHYMNAEQASNVLAQNSGPPHRNAGGDSNYVNHAAVDPHSQRTKHSFQNSNHSNVQSVTNSHGFKYNQEKGYPCDDSWNTDFHKKSQGNNEASTILQGRDFRHKPVPIAGRLLRGQTLPGGFHYNEHSGSISQSAFFSKDLSLFHLLLSYELLPFTAQLPDSHSILSLIQLREMPLQNCNEGLPDSPKGRMANIGSPGSAFTPVRNIPERGDQQSTCGRLICVSEVCGELHKFTVLGNLLEEDIIIEVNGSLCLDTNVQFMEKILRSCSGLVSMTVARLRETQNKLISGDYITQVQRIKSLEAEISRLDDIIQLRDERIRDLTSCWGAGNRVNRSDITTTLPIEGMVIGDDEYVV